MSHSFSEKKKENEKAHETPQGIGDSNNPPEASMNYLTKQMKSSNKKQVWYKENIPTISEKANSSKNNWHLY